ncbi:MAG: IPTL-CTERM sorting domain-containing protein [bacterium]
MKTFSKIMLSSLMSGALISSATAGTFYFADDSTTGLSAQASFQGVAGTTQTVDFEAFNPGAILTGNEFLGQGVQLAGFSGGGDTEASVTPFSGLTRCITADRDDGTLRVLSNSNSESGIIDITFDPPVSAAGVTVAYDSEGDGSGRRFSVYAPGGVMLDTDQPIFDTTVGEPGFIGWVGAPGEFIERFSIGRPAGSGDGQAYCSIEYASEAKAIPTMSVWGLGILAGLLGLVGMRRKFK